MFDTPVLLLIFNRPHTTEKVLRRLEEVQPARLYIAADGPRKNRSGEVKLCNSVRQKALNVSWDGEVKTLFRNHNLGCRKAVSKAIDWFFEHEEQGIILEDDCIPNNSFFPFCSRLLERYRNNEKVMTISGNNFQPNPRTKYDYYFSRYMHCWGWATWKRAWENFDWAMTLWPESKKEGLLEQIFEEKKAVQYWMEIFDRVYANEIDSWAYIWTLSIWAHGGVNILPEVNLVSNIGFDKDGTHTTFDEDPAANMATSELTFPLNHPDVLERHEKADKYTQYHHFQPSLMVRTVRKVRRMLLS